MSKEDAKKKARKLRRLGKSYKQISEELNVSKGSVSLWVRDIQLSEKQKRELPKSNGALGGEANRKLWEQRKIEVRESYNPPLDDPEYTFGLALYWGEGSKYSESVVELTNSEPVLLKYFLKWVTKYFGAEKFVVRIQHHYPNRDQAMKKYWANVLGVPVSCFSKSTFLPPSDSRKRVCDGIVRVRVVGENTWKIRQKIQQAMNFFVNAP